MQPLWSRRSVLVFFLVGFGIPWLGWSSIALLGLDRSTPLARVLFYTGDFMAVAGFAAAWVAAGRPGLASVGRRCLQMRPVSPGWALFALFLPMTWVAPSIVLYGLTHGGIGRVEPTGLLQYFAPGVLLALTTGPLGEEAGWRGFLLPRLLRRYSPMEASLGLGLIWSIWHFPLYQATVFSTIEGGLRFTVAVLCFSLLLTVLWAFTGASVLWAMVLHWTINISENVVRAVLPDLRPPDNVSDWSEIAILAVVTIIVALAVRPSRLQARLEETMQRLGAESIDADQDRS